MIYAIDFIEKLFFKNFAKKFFVKKLFFNFLKIESRAKIPLFYHFSLYFSICILLNSFIKVFFYHILSQNKPFLDHCDKNYFMTRVLP